MPKRTARTKKASSDQPNHEAYIDQSVEAGFVFLNNFQPQEILFDLKISAQELLASGANKEAHALRSAITKNTGVNHGTSYRDVLKRLFDRDKNYRVTGDFDRPGQVVCTREAQRPNSG